MRKAITIFLLFQSVILFADYKQDYISLLEGKNYIELKILLDKWINKEPKNPEVYIAFFNYFLSKGRITGVAIESKPKGNQQIVITNPDSGEIVGYINDSSKYNTNDLKKAFEYISQGLSISPNRLDMHFGEIHLLGEIINYQKQCDQMIKTLLISKTNDNKWLWDNNEEIKDGKSFMLNNMQDYVITWINDRNEGSLQALKRFCEKEIELYPDIVFGYNNYAYYFILIDDKATSLKWLLKAEKVNSKDSIVLLNIARIYFQNNNLEKTRYYLNKIIKVGDPKYAQYAKDQLKEIF